MATAGEKQPMDRLKDDVAQVRGKVAEMDVKVENELPTEAGMTYLQVKNHALLTYTKMELFFALLKLEQPDKVKDHPVFKELVRYRTLLERIRPLDRKMKYQVDKMLKVALSGGKGMDESLNYAPNPDELAAEDGHGDDEDGEEGGSGSKDGIYRAPRLAAVPYEEEERAQVKQAKKDERNRKRLQKSTILSELREEFSERPTEILASGTSVVDKEIAREEAEKKDFEESRFVRVVTSRKDKIRKRQREMEANRADHVGSIDNFAAVQDILSLDKTKHRIPTPHEPKKVGGKTGGIFSHVDAPTEKKRKVGRSSGSSGAAHAAAGPSATATSGSTSSAPKKSSGKKKVVFSNLFSALAVEAVRKLQRLERVRSATEKPQRHELRRFLQGGACHRCVPQAWCVGQPRGAHEHVVSRRSGDALETDTRQRKELGRQLPRLLGEATQGIAWFGNTHVCWYP